MLNVLSNGQRPHYEKSLPLLGDKDCSGRCPLLGRSGDDDLLLAGDDDDEDDDPLTDYRRLTSCTA